MRSHGGGDGENKKIRGRHGQKSESAKASASGHIDFVVVTSQREGEQAELERERASRAREKHRKDGFDHGFRGHQNRSGGEEKQKPFHVAFLNPQESIWDFDEAQCERADDQRKRDDQCSERKKDEGEHRRIARNFSRSERQSIDWAREPQRGAFKGLDASLGAARDKKLGPFEAAARLQLLKRAEEGFEGDASQLRVQALENVGNRACSIEERQNFSRDSRKGHLSVSIARFKQ